MQSQVSGALKRESGSGEEEEEKVGAGSECNIRCVHPEIKGGHVAR